MMYVTPSQKGFSIVEMLVYLGVLIAASVIVVSTFLSLKTVFERNRVERAIATSAGNALDRVAREVRMADMVDLGQSVLNATSSKLVLTQGATTTSFYIATGTVVMAQNGIEQGLITSPRLTVNSLTFSRFSNSFSDAVRVSLSVSSFSTVASTTQTFYTTAVLRGSYE